MAIEDPDEKPYSEEESYGILRERKNLLWRIANVAQMAYQSLTRLPRNRRESREQRERVLQDLDHERVLEFQAMNKIKDQKN